MKQMRNHTSMRLGGLLATGLILAAVSRPAAAAEGRISGPSESLISSAAPQGWTVGIQYGMDGRELKGAGEILELDAGRAVVELGYEVAPFLQLAANAGWTQADLGDDSGENGLAWAAIARANLAEYVLQESPEVGRKQWMGAAVEIQYRSSESSQDLADLNWAETLIVPSLYYFRNHRGEAMRTDYQATGFGLHGGLAFSFIDGELGSVDLEENRDFGFMLGGDARWGTGWVARLRATVYGSGDQNFEIGALFHF